MEVLFGLVFGLLIGFMQQTRPFRLNRAAPAMPGILRAKWAYMVELYILV